MENKEGALQINLEKFLSTYFHIGHEVWSDGPNRKRIDIVLVHKSDLNVEYPIGIEVKQDDKKRGAKLAEWIKQASEYSKKNFIGYGKCLIITYPQVSGLYLREGEKMNHHEIIRDGSVHDYGQSNNIATFLSAFNIGELQKYRNWSGEELCRIAYKGQRIWDMKDDKLRINNYKMLVK